MASYCQKWCLTIDLSGGRVDVGHLDSIVGFHPSNHLGQMRVAPTFVLKYNIRTRSLADPGAIEDVLAVE